MIPLLWRCHCRRQHLGRDLVCSCDWMINDRMINAFLGQSGGIVSQPSWMTSLHVAPFATRMRTLSVLCLAKLTQQPPYKRRFCGHGQNSVNTHILCRYYHYFIAVFISCTFGPSKKQEFIKKSE